MTKIMRRKKLQEKSSPEKMPFQQIVKYMIERTRLQIYALGVQDFLEKAKKVFEEKWVVNPKKHRHAR